MRHLIDPTDLTVQETEQIVALAEDIIANRSKYSEACKGKKLATLFYEPSTRTRLSFTSAMLELGGQVIGFSDANSSSVSKGETVADTVRVIRCFADIIAMRHFKEGAPLVASQYAGVPVINAGDGSHSHPTQTLTDLLTIKREKGRFDHMTIGFCGDLKFGRTVHSLIKALSRYEGIEVILISPEELRLPDYMLQEMQANSKLTFREVRTMEEVMPELDILYMTRVQKERFLDEEEFDRVKNSFVGGHDDPAPAAARERDHAGGGQRPARGLLPAGGERQVRAYGADSDAASVGGREPALRAYAGFRRGVPRQRAGVPEPPLHLGDGGCGPAVPAFGRRHVPLRLLRGEGALGRPDDRSGFVRVPVPGFSVRIVDKLSILILPGNFESRAKIATFVTIF